MPTNPLLVVIPYHSGDLDETNKLLVWISELGGCPGHHCLLMADQAVPKEERLKVKQLAANVFSTVQAVGAKLPPPVPEGDAKLAQKHSLANKMFSTAASVVFTQFKLPFLWLESDCIPLVPGWLDKLSDEYRDCPRPYMGAVIKTDRAINSASMPEKFMAGCGVYPQNAYEEMEKFCRNNLAWDIAAADVVVAKAYNTPLIHHFWGRPSLPPAFRPDTDLCDAGKNEFYVRFVSKEAVLFHRNKDGSLIRLLRKQMATPKRKIAAAEAKAAAIPEPTPIMEE